LAGWIFLWRVLPAFFVFFVCFARVGILFLAVSNVYRTFHFKVQPNL